MKITTQEISEKQALKLYSDLIILDIAELEKSKSKSKDRRNNILNVLRNLKSVFTGVSFHYDSKSESEPEFKESTSERTKLRRQILDEIAKKEKMINPKLFIEYTEYLSPSDMYKDLNKSAGLVKNKAQVNTIKKQESHA